MPPRRSSRAPSSSRLFDGTTEAGVSADTALPPAAAAAIRTSVASRGMSPGPAKFSSAYGSPPTVVPVRQNVARQRYNLTSALSHVMEAVDQDIENDARQRQEREAAEQRLNRRAGSVVAPAPAPAPAPVAEAPAQNLPEDDSDPSQQLYDTTASFSTNASFATLVSPDQETPRPVRRSRSARASRASSEQADLEKTLQPVQPVRRSARVARRSTESPSSDSTARSFIEEENVFADAEIMTPTVPQSGLLAKSSSLFQNLLLSSASKLSSRFSAIREEPRETETSVQQLQQQYPHLHFIHPRPDNVATSVALDDTPSARPVASMAERRAARATLALAAAQDRQLQKEIEADASATPEPPVRATRSKSRVANPGPVPRPQRSSRQNSVHDSTPDELAGTVDVSAMTSRQQSFGRRDPVPEKIPEQSIATEQSIAAEQSLATEQSRASAQSLGAEKQSHLAAEPGADSPPSAPAPDADSASNPEAAASKNHSQNHTRRPPLLRSLGRLSHFLSLAITFLVLGFVVLRVFVISTSPVELYEGYRVDNRLHWYGRDWRSNLRQLVPFALVHPLGALSDEEFARLNGLLLHHADEIAQLKRGHRLHSDALERIDRILPAVVHMDLDRRGRPVVAQEFWHALKDNILADKDIFTLLQRKDGHLAVSDIQWNALKYQLETSGLLPEPKPDESPASKALSVRDVEAIVEADLSRSWEAWLRRNQAQVKAVLGIAETAPSSPSSPAGSVGLDLDHLPEDQLVRLAQQMAASGKAREILVSRQDFLQILQQQFVEHRLDIKGELAELEAHVVELARDAAEAVKKAFPGPTGVPSADSGSGLSKKEITQLVDRLVRRSVSDAQLEAMARGRIKSNWRAHLIHQVNYFNKKTGAIFNYHFSSPAFSPYIPPFYAWRHRSGSLGKLLWSVGLGGGGGSSHAKGSAFTGGGGDGGDGGGMGGGGSGDGGSGYSHWPAPGSLRGSAAFDKWEEAGDCWCAATNRGRAAEKQQQLQPLLLKKQQQTADVAIKLGLRIVPQHLVVEHIRASATLDPGSMPKDLEVWAQFTEYNLQRTLQDWSLAEFPDTDQHHPLMGWGFVKIGAFTYDRGYDENGSGGNSGKSTAADMDGVQVFRLPPDLEALEAGTDHLIVRAVNNYGQLDHTCFYRLRMYGIPLPD